MGAILAHRFVDQLPFDQLEMLLVENPGGFRPFAFGARPAFARRVLRRGSGRTFGERGRHAV